MEKHRLTFSLIYIVHYLLSLIITINITRDDKMKFNDNNNDSITVYDYSYNVNNTLFFYINNIINISNQDSLSIY